MNIPKNKLITCPYCNAEYLANEIFINKYFSGSVKSIVKTPEGRIVGFTGEEPDLVETYICDFCATPFNVKGDYVWDIDKNITLEEAFNNSVTHH